MRGDGSARLREAYSERVIEYQASLLDDALPEAADGFVPLDRMVRTRLSSTAWVDFLPGWLQGSEPLLDRLLARVPWAAERRWMYSREVDVPRLTCHFASGEPLPDPLLVSARQLLSEHYEPELGEPLVSAGLCLYRTGQDSVAWHGDTIGRGRSEDTVVAILSLGSPRTLALRPRRGGPARHRFPLGHGDLLVMGGSCQRTWEHAVPKTAKQVGPRISVQFRAHGVR